MAAAAAAAAEGTDVEDGLFPVKSGRKTGIRRRRGGGGGDGGGMNRGHVGGGRQHYGLNGHDYAFDTDPNAS